MPVLASAAKLDALAGLDRAAAPTERMPVLFLGHGSPMNAIEENRFSKSWRALGESLPRPKAILCISAHWETRGTYLTAGARPETLHDFGGFPQALFDVQYPAPGSADLVAEARAALGSDTAGTRSDWGLDHGAWSILKHLYPAADVPVVQLSLDHTLTPEAHYDLAKRLAGLRRRGVLILGSGNMVHNLRRVDFSKADAGADWAIEADATFKRLITNNDHKGLAAYRSLGTAVAQAVPTPDHYLPLLYTLALQEADEAPTLFNDELMYGSLSMTSVRIG